jgi:hypothetical protein
MSLRLPILYASVAITMAWGAIEKFGYPYWTFPLLADHPGVTFGLGYQEFMYVAGFVEFSLAFFMLAGTALLRGACLFLLLLVTGAIPAFGKVDAVGHGLIIASLVVMIIAGHRVLRLPSVIERSPPLTRAGLLTAAYSASFVGLTVVYYASQAGAGR